MKELAKYKRLLFQERYLSKIRLKIFQKTKASALLGLLLCYLHYRLMIKTSSSENSIHAKSYT